MDNQKLFLFIALSLVIMLIFGAWQERTQPQSQQEPSSARTETTAIPADAPSMPTVNEKESLTDVPQDIVAEKTAMTPVARGGERITVVTDRLRVEIDTIGGEISRAWLLTYPVAQKQPDVPFQLLNDTEVNVFVAQSGLLASVGAAPDHRALFRAEKNEYRLAEGEDELKVLLQWQGEDGVKVVKTYTFRRDDYLIDIAFDVDNASHETWKGRQYSQFQRTEMGRESFFIYTYTGGVVSTTADPYEKVQFSDMAEWKPEQSYNLGGWVAMLQHYFLGAWVPGSEDANHFYTKALAEGRYLLGLTGKERNIAPGDNGHFNIGLYVGPKEQHRLEDIEENLRLTVDYGVLDILAKPVFWLLEKIHSFVGNWGVAIIIITLMIKIVFYKLSEASYKSMANMRRLSPKLKTLKERYGDDRQKMNQAMMEIYKKEKINPLGGCLPILVQIPVFISLYWVLLESVELRQAPFMLWLSDLSAKDPYYVLPLLMGASMFIQQKLNPPPMDPIQQKIMQFLPVIFTAFFAFFPAGLVLYWVVNNILSIAQQWYITQKIESQAAKV